VFVLLAALSALAVVTLFGALVFYLVKIIEVLDSIGGRRREDTATGRATSQR
jgi:hypothetical protein